jgi:hypothetical protein
MLFHASSIAEICAFGRESMRLLIIYVVGCLTLNQLE